MYRLETLGGLALLDGNGSPAATQRRRLVLLAVLASAGDRGLSREKLIGLLWADSPTESARHALEQFLSTLRRQLGDGVFLGTDPIRLNSAILSSDLAQFGEAVGRGNLAAAAGFYRGPFLDGVSLNDAGELERWVDAEREHARARYVTALEKLATGEAEGGRHAAAVGWWRKLAVADPLGTRGAIGLIRSLAAAGDPAAAMQHARVYQAMVQDQLDIPPDPQLARLMADLQTGRLGRAEAGEGTAQRETEPVAAESLAQSADTRSVRGEGAGIVAPAGVHRSKGRRFWLGVAVLGVIAAALLLVRRPPAPISAKPIRIAVLPYENLGPPEDEYFADGLAEAITNGLSGIPGIVPIGRQSVLKYKAVRRSAGEIGKELSVDYVLGGTVQWPHAGKGEPRVKITSELQRTEDNANVWSKSDEGVFGDVFSLQADVAEHVLSNLHITLLDSVRRALRRPATKSLAAYREYLLGHSQWVLRTGTTIAAAIGHFQRAIDLDSSFALAYAGLADAWVVYPNFWSRIDSTQNLVPSAAIAYERAQAAAGHALGLDSTLIQARAALAYQRFMSSHDARRGIDELTAVVHLDPNYPFARHYLRHALAASGQAAEALVESRMAVELDPLSPLGNTVLAVDYAAAGRTVEAMAALRQAIEVSPTFAQAYMVLGTLLWQGGQRQGGADTLRLFLELRGYPRSGDSVVAAALAGRAPATSALRVLDQFVRSDWEPEPRLAGLYALLGAKKRALDVLETVKARHVGELLLQRYQPFLRTLADEPRFKALWADVDRRS
jgi:DNA-binding SARP family transcriptional activator/TolB-like protein/tetratricopeptide (TPR) repeat protein